MTGKRRGDGSAKPIDANSTRDAAPGGAPDAIKPDSTAAKASVHEAIGTLIGDDDERRRGTAEKKASDIAADKPRKPPGS